MSTKADRVFEQCWYSYIQATAEIFLKQQYGPAITRHPNFRAAVKTGSESLTAIFRVRRALQHDIFSVLQRELEGKTELLDIFSGEATATMPLVMSGSLDRLTLLDNCHSTLPPRVCELMVEKLRLGDRIKRLNTTLDANTDLSLIPRHQQVSLIESGLGVPPEHRCKEEQGATDPRVFRSSHVFRAAADMGDILRALGGVPERVLHLFDTPAFGNPLARSGMREYVQGFVDGHPEWRIKAWDVVREDSLQHGVLVHE